MGFEGKEGFGLCCFIVDKLLLLPAVVGSILDGLLTVLLFAFQDGVGLLGIDKAENVYYAFVLRCEPETSGFAADHPEFVPTVLGGLFYKQPLTSVVLSVKYNDFHFVLLVGDARQCTN